MAIANGTRRADGFTLRKEGVLASPLSQRASKQSRVPSCRIYPNGEFGLGYKFPREESLPLQHNHAGGVSSGHMRSEASKVALESRLACQVSRILTEAKRALSGKRYGLRGMTNYGKKMVRNAGYLLESKYGKSRITFLTLTVPPLSLEGARRVAQNWGEIIRQLGQWIYRKLDRRGLPGQYVLVSEIQPQRVSNGRLESLHVHAAFVGRLRSGNWAIHYSEIRSFWCSLLSRVSGETVESQAVERLERVKKSVENYLSKYMSKGSEEIEKLIEIGGVECVPKQWWNMNNLMREEIKSGMLKGENVSIILELLIKNHYQGHGSEAFKFCRIIERDITDYQSIVVGYFGRLTRETLADLTELCQGLKSA